MLSVRAHAQGAKPTTVGFLYAATRNDYGFNQSFAVAARRIAELPGMKLIEQERVPETAQAERVMEGGDQGAPIVASDAESSAARALTAIAGRVAEYVGAAAAR